MNSDLIGLLEKLKEARLTAKAAGEDAEEFQRAALPLLKADDPDDKGLEIEAWGKKFSAHYQQNQAPENWDLEELVPWLIAEGHWEHVCTEILDQDKLESEMRAGRISRKEIRRFKLVGNRPKAFVRFDKPPARVVKIRRRRSK